MNMAEQYTFAQFSFNCEQSDRTSGAGNSSVIPHQYAFYQPGLGVTVNADHISLDSREITICKQNIKEEK